MSSVDFESVPAAGRFRERGKELIRGFYGRAAVLADEVTVGTGRQMVGGRSVAEVRVNDDA